MVDGQRTPLTIRPVGMCVASEWRAARGPRRAVDGLTQARETANREEYLRLTLTHAGSLLAVEERRAARSHTMGRIRTIKPEFFTSEDIAALSPLARLLYIAIWCEADREGRLKWKPRTFKARYLPFDDCDSEKLCKEIVQQRLVIPYGDNLAYIPTFPIHQHINPRESVSILPKPPIDASVTRDDACKSGFARTGRKGKEGEGKEVDSFETSSKPPSDDESNPSNPAASSAVLVFPVVGGGPTEWPLTEAKLAEYRESYPSLDVLAEFRKARQWLIDNQPHRKTPRGMPRFLGRWLGRAQDSGRGAAKPGGLPPARERIATDEDLANWRISVE